MVCTCRDNYKYFTVTFSRLSVGDYVGVSNSPRDCDAYPPSSNPLGYLYVVQSTTNDSSVFASEFAAATSAYLSSLEAPFEVCVEGSTVSIMVETGYSSPLLASPNLYLCLEGSIKVVYDHGRAWLNCDYLEKDCEHGAAYYDFKIDSIQREASIHIISGVCDGTSLGYLLDTEDPLIAANRLSRILTQSMNDDIWMLAKHLGDGRMRMIISPKLLKTFLLLHPFLFETEITVCTYDDFNNPGYSGPPLAQISYPIGRFPKRCNSRCCYKFHEVSRVYR